MDKNQQKILIIAGMKTSRIVAYIENYIFLIMSAYTFYNELISISILIVETS